MGAVPMNGTRRAGFIVCRAFCYLLAVVWLVNLATMASFSTRTPDPMTFHTQPWDDHGVTLYRNPWQGFILIWGWVGTLVFGLVSNTIENKDWWKTIGRSKTKT